MTPATEFENSREKMAAVAHWLGWQDEDMSYGLKSISDAEKLYDYWDVRGDDLPEMADTVYDDEGCLMALFRLDALGYDPLDDFKRVVSELAQEQWEAIPNTYADWEDLADCVQEACCISTFVHLMREYKLKNLTGKEWNV